MGERRLNDSESCWMAVGLRQRANVASQVRFWSLFRTNPWVLLLVVEATSGVGDSVVNRVGGGRHFVADTHGESHRMQFAEAKIAWLNDGHGKELLSNPRRPMRYSPTLTDTKLAIYAVRLMVENTVMRFRRIMDI